MKGLRTRNMFVDVARKLFAKNGLDSTTMNDISDESGLSRRSIYTYFKNKEEIYWAVVQSELDRLSEKMTKVAKMDMEPDKKLVRLIFSHLESVKETVCRNGNLRAEFFRDVWRVESVRKNFDRNEILIFRKVMNEGVDSGYFDIQNVKLLSVITHYCVKGCEVPYIYGRIVVNSPEDLYPYVHRLVHKALAIDQFDFTALRRKTPYAY